MLALKCVSENDRLLIKAKQKLFFDTGAKFSWKTISWFYSSLDHCEMIWDLVLLAF